MDDVNAVSCLSTYRLKAPLFMVARSTVPEESVGNGATHLPHICANVSCPREELDPLHPLARAQSRLARKVMEMYD